jgi:excinuclease UvrABC helicase subunit UvrB
MSTRAIIAIPVDGGYNTAWCWNDGYPDNLGQTLRRKFKTREQVLEIVESHSFSSLMTKRIKADYDELCKSQCMDPATYKELSNGTFLKIDPHHGGVVAGEGENGFFENVKQMLEQDLNYVYVFENDKWKTYK